MAQNQLFDSEIVPVNSLDIFEKEKLTFSILDSYEFRQMPSLPYTQESPIIFEIPGQTTSFLSPNIYIDMTLKAKKKVQAKDASGNAIAGSYIYEDVLSHDKMTIDCIPFHTTFSSVQVALNGVKITNKNDKYPYLAYLDRVHLTDEETYLIHQGLEDGKMNEAGTSKDFDGTVQKERAGRIYSNQDYFLRGKLVSPIFQQPRYILPSVTVTIELMQTSNAFRVVCDESSPTIEFFIDKIYVVGHRLVPNAQLLMDTMKALKETPARYPITRFEPQLIEIPKGAQHCEKLLSLPTSKAPRMVFLSVYESKSIYGDKLISAYRAKCSDIESAYIQIEDQKFPVVPYCGQKREGQLKMFSDYKQNTKQLMGGKNNFMDYGRYSQDFTVMSFNLDRFHGTERNAHDINPEAVTMPRMGTCSLHVKMAMPLPEAYSLIVIMVYNDVITIDDSLVPHTDF